MTNCHKSPKIVIEKGIPIPDRATYRIIPYPFADLNVGDSFSIPLSDETLLIGKNAITRNVATYPLRDQLTRFRKRPGNADKKFTVVELKDEGLVRCWRTA